jgi:excisionase family DNA binding protein
MSTKIIANTTYTVEEAAELLGVNPETIRRYIRGKVPNKFLPNVKVGKRNVIQGQSLIDLIGGTHLQIPGVQFEQSLVRLNPRFYGSASEIIRISREAPSRGQMLKDLANFIDEVNLETK